MASFAERAGWLAEMLLVLGWALCALPLAGQSVAQARFQAGQPAETREALEGWLSAPGVPASSDALIEQMARAAGVIFAGEVVAVRRPDGIAGSAEDASEGIVEVDFRVTQAVLGPATGSIYGLREWSGLWTGNSRRYRTGQRLLLFLRAPDGRGFSSPVHGAEGAIPLRGGGIAPGPDDAAVAGAAGWNVDLRWVQAHVLRGPEWLSIAERGPGGPNPVRGRSPNQAEAADQGDASPERLQSRRLEPLVPRPPAPPAETEPLSQVLALCVRVMRQDAPRRHDAPR